MQVPSPGPPFGKRLRHAVEQAEPVVDGPERIDVLLQPVGRSRLDDEERSVGLEERSDLLKGLIPILRLSDRRRPNRGRRQT